jgi:hypothetical protein
LNFTALFLHGYNTISYNLTRETENNQLIKPRRLEDKVVLLLYYESR